MGLLSVQPPKASANATFADIVDGSSTTILAVESKREVPWTKPEDIPFDVKGPLPELNGFVENGFNAAFVDGSVRFIAKSIDPTVLKALITRDGGELINIPDGPARRSRRRAERFESRRTLTPRKHDRPGRSDRGARPALLCAGHARSDTSGVKLVY